MDKIKEKLLKKYPCSLELHAHSSPVSVCSDFPYDKFADAFIKDGFDGVALTNHLTPKQLDTYGSCDKAAEFYLEDYRKIKEYAGDRLSVSLGAEIKFRENDNEYLVYGICEDDIPKLYSYIDKGIDVFYKEFKNDSNVIIQAHPMRPNNEHANPDSLDGIEVYNFHPHHNAQISAVAEYAKKQNKLITGGTDFHHEYQRKLSVLRCKKVPKNSYEVAELIKSGDFIFLLNGGVLIP